MMCRISALRTRRNSQNLTSMYSNGQVLCTFVKKLVRPWYYKFTIHVRVGIPFLLWWKLLKVVFWRPSRYQVSLYEKVVGFDNTNSCIFSQIQYLSICEDSKSIYLGIRCKSRAFCILASNNSCYKRSMPKVII